MAYLSIFVTVFLAELGDKTQLATLLFATDAQVNKMGVFLASASALVLSSFLAVVIGDQLTAYVPIRTIKITAGIGFMAIGLWVFIDALR